MIRIVLIGFLLGMVAAMKDPYEPYSHNEINVDRLVDFQLSILRDLTPSKAALGNLTVDNVVMVGAQLGDFSTIVRRGHAFIRNVSANALVDGDTVGLDDFTLDMDRLIVSGEDLGPANISIKGSGLYFDRITHFYYKNCTQEYNRLKASRIESAYLTVQGNRTDITDRINNEVLKNLNKYMRTDEFKKFVDETFSQCKKIRQSSADVTAAILNHLHNF